MFTIDERVKGLPALKEQVMSLYESLNQPHLAVPGRQAGPARAYILGLRGPSGFAVFVYLYMPESGQCAVYVPEKRIVQVSFYLRDEPDPKEPGKTKIVQSDYVDFTLKADR